MLSPYKERETCARFSPLRWRLCRQSKRLSYGKKELEMTDILLGAAPRNVARIDARIEQVLPGPIESDEGGRIDTVRQVDPDGPDRCAVADAEADSVHHVVE